MYILFRPELLNFRARSIINSNTVGSGNYFMPFSASGLNGDGQVVSVADTGVDVKSCYFIDPHGNLMMSENSISFITLWMCLGKVTPSQVSHPITDSSIRKVIQYSYNPNGGDSSDETGGHGT